MAEEKKTVEPRINLAIDREVGGEHLILDTFVRDSQFVLTCWVSKAEITKRGVHVYVSVSRATNVDGGEYLVFALHPGDRIGMDPGKYSSQEVETLKECIMEAARFMVYESVISHRILPQIETIVNGMPLNMGGDTYKLDGVSYQFTFGERDESKEDKK